MASPFLSEIRIFSFNYAPKGWTMCNGQIMAINQNQALFALLGTTYGGDGRATFALPNLQGAVAMGFSSAYPLGQKAGEANHTLSTAEMPQHTHAVHANSAAGLLSSPAGDYWAKDPNGSLTYGAPANTNLANAAVANAGSNQGHNNLMPYLTLNFCIALQGIFPSQN